MRVAMGLPAAFFLAKNAVPMRRGRVAWLTAFKPITVAGPRPIHTAFPASLACKLKFECKPCSQCVSIAGRFHYSVLRNDCLHGVAKTREWLAAAAAQF